MPILPKERDPRLITVRRGGSLTDEHHRLLAEWALRCAEHVLPLFEAHRPDDARPRHAIEVGRAWIRGEARMTEARLLAETMAQAQVLGATGGQPLPPVMSTSPKVISPEQAQPMATPPQPLQPPGVGR